MDKIKTIAQFITAFAGAGVILYGAFTFISTAKESNRLIKEFEQINIDIQSEIKHLKDTLTLQIHRVETKQDHTIEAVQRNTGELLVLKRTVLDEFAKENPAEKVLQLVREFEKSIQPDVSIVIRKKDGKKE